MLHRAFICSCFALFATAVQAAPSDYRFVSVYSQGIAVNGFDLTGGAINNHGTMAVMIDPGNGIQTLYRVNGPVWTKVWEAVQGNDAFGVMDINDVNQIVGTLNICCAGERKLQRIDEDGTVTTFATRIFGCPNEGEFCEFGSIGQSLNDAGQFVNTARYNFGEGSVQSVWRFGDGQPVEIARAGNNEPGDLVNITPPSINESGVVAFGATEIDDPGNHAYTGSGGALTQEGTALLPQGGQILQALINNHGEIALLANGVQILDAGVITTILPAQFGIGGPQPLSFNNNGDVAFRGCIGSVCGIFTGSDPDADAVLRNGDPLFDGVVSGGDENAFRIGWSNLNDNGEITFKVQIDVDGIPFVSHLVHAIPLSPLVDSDDDGIANDVDNCLTSDNPNQVDSDGDGFGNLCDADLDNDGVVNVTDLGLFKGEFFTTDADADFNGDGLVNALDLGILKLLFFRPPGPSALAL